MEQRISGSQGGVVGKVKSEERSRLRVLCVSVCHFYGVMERWSDGVRNDGVMERWNDLVIYFGVVNEF